MGKPGYVDSGFECSTLLEYLLYAGMADLNPFWGIFKSFFGLKSWYTLLSEGLRQHFQSYPDVLSHVSNQKHRKLNIRGLSTASLFQNSEKSYSHNVLPSLSSLLLTFWVGKPWGCPNLSNSWNCICILFYSNLKYIYLYTIFFDKKRNMF